MKAVFVFACLIAAVYGEICTTTGTAADCSLTTCTGDGWDLHCADGKCVCTHGGTVGDCATNADCHNAHIGGISINCNIHIGPINLVPVCRGGECHCGRQ
ncbi:uncharacterized protein LOC128204069 [Mya arenaria]|uniref:uncharacterized protein LOC128204069 n=1 Tax=Mya arenaria TaxID=6604 RepID=UPI0022DF510F|nr:uncharacterized protein LOC128204069 [Mya arenaria]